MKKRILVLMLVAVGMVLALTNTARSGDDEKKPADPTAMSPEQMQAAMEAYLAQQKPGDHHKVLAHFVGEWNIETKVWMAGPGGKPDVSTGTSKITPILGGRFIKEGVKSTMMGRPYEGMGLIGYNNVRNVYEGTWTSSMDTHITSMVGTLQPDKDGEMNVFNFYGEMDEPMLNMFGRIVNYRTTILGKDKHKFEIYDLAAGPDFKVIEIMYTRK